uniref:Beta-glucosidase n=1 Tax=Coptotermes formosanus TaxID=36987 RepID=G9I468_COPFO|nr:beta-glucosidase [Coptotermes formosanus]
MKLLLFFFGLSISEGRVFPPSFKFCAATAAYQIEGAAREEGRSPSIWDVFSHIPGKTDGGQNGDNAVDHYHLFKDDIDLMKQLNFDVFRFSLSPSRILPTPDYKVNEEGIFHYRRVLEYLKFQGIKPLVTLFHWDLPQYMDELYGGLLNATALKEFFSKYAEAAFDGLGDLVDSWSTFNEPYTSCMQGYQYGSMAPGRNIHPESEPYDCIHAVLVSHGAVAKIFKEKFPKGTSNKTISIAVNCDWQEPYTDSEEDKNASIRGLDYYLHVFMDPIYFGKYPDGMVERSQGHLKPLTPEEVELINGSVDVFALNSYTSNYVYNDPNLTLGESYDNDGLLGKTFTSINGTSIGNVTEPSWLYNVPWGIGKLIRHINQRYNPGEILVTENGLCVTGEPNWVGDEVLKDQGRIDFYKGYLNAILDAVEEGVPVSTFCAWSMFDNYEWARGYTQRFGITYVNYTTQERFFKDSALWFGRLINRTEGV